MSTAVRGLILVAAFSSLAGCGSAPYKSIDAATEAKITASQGVLGVQQPQIYAAVQPTSGNPMAGGGTFIGGAVNGAINSLMADKAHEAAEEGLQPLRDALQGFDFDSLALSGFQADLPKATWLHLNQMSLTKDASGAGLDKFFDSSQLPYALFVSLDYHLSYDFRQLIVAEHMWLCPKPLPGSKLRHGPNGYTYTMPGSDESNAIYESTVSYVTAVPEGVIPHQTAHQEQAAAAIQYWAKDHGAVARARLRDAIAELSRLSLQALQNPGKPAKVRDEVAFGLKEGQVLENHDNARMVIQFDDGSLLSIDATLVRILRTGKID